jgi:hypothetical protein
MRPILISLLLALTIGGLLALRAAPTQSFTSPHDGGAGLEDKATQVNDSYWLGWTVPVNLSQCPNKQATYPTLGVTSDGRTLYLAWTDGRAASKDIYCATSADGGWGWMAPRPAWATAADSWRPSLVISNTTPLLAWAESLSSTGHATYQMALGGTAPETVPNDHTLLAYAPRLALGPGGELHLALQGGIEPKPDILYSRREAGASEWPTATVVFDSQHSGSYYPAVAVSADGQTTHLVWQEKFSGYESEIYYLRGRRSGEEIIWEAATSLSQGILRSVRPAITLQARPDAGETVYVAWGEQESGYDTQYVRFSRSDNGGSDWTPPSRVTPQFVKTNKLAPTDVAPALAVTPAGVLCAAWHGFPPGTTPEAEEVYLACSTDGGAHWNIPVNVSHSPETISIRPVLAVGRDSILHLAWQDQELQSDNPVSEYQIFYTHSLPHAVMLPIVKR